MKKSLFVSVLLIGLLFDAKAQEKPIVGIVPFTYVQGAASVDDVNSIQETVTNAFVKTRRFNIVDRSKMESLKKEKELQKSEDFIDGSIAQQGVSLGANYLIAGHVLSAQADQMETAPDETTGQTTITFKSKLSINLKVIEVATGEVIRSETIEPKGGSLLAGMVGLGASSPEAAIAKAIKDIEEKIDAFVDENFPVSFPIVEIVEKDKKGNAINVMIAGGSGYNLKKGDKLRVVELSVMEVNGKQLQRKKEIGELRITTVEDENFSICSVRSGGLAINSKFEGNATILVFTSK
ncbi:CsgG/HfaB family protein [Cyclobacterium xiamenense]|uniref:CsgG/HfaB family protein n=1 Tax=Cyclobacterium xiamenense TaxID=1297121 RepID=UPI001386FEFC|nr:CsgG/HfaB family protein [Cyclobacterium xiamenense]